MLLSGPHLLCPSAPVTLWVLNACSLSAVTEEESDVRALFRCEKAGQRCGARLSSPSGPWQHTVLSQSLPSLAGSVRTFFDSSLTAFKELTHQTWFQFSFFPSHPCSITFTTNFCLSLLWPTSLPHSPGQYARDNLSILFVWDLSCLLPPWLHVCVHMRVCVHTHTHTLSLSLSVSFSSSSPQTYKDRYYISSLLLLVAQLVKYPPTMQETSFWFLGWEDPLEKG